jgi:hypothetical protein
MSTVRHTIAPFGTRNPSAPITTKLLLTREAKLMERAGRALLFHFRDEAGSYGPARSYGEILDISRSRSNHSDVGREYVVGVQYDPANADHVKPLFKVRTVEIGWPIAPTEGKPGIDRIVGALQAEFGKRFGIYNGGICVDKPGLHGTCEAYDAMVRYRTADEAHERVLVMGNWERQRMLENMRDTREGLPINGVIAMDIICSRDRPDWHDYGGETHVTHTHTSQWPNSIPGWV